MKYPLTPDEARDMRDGNKIRAINSVRGRTGLDLRMAKNYVEAWNGRDVLKEPDRHLACSRCGGTGVEPAKDAP